MQFRIDADGRRGLRVIGEIPDLDLCRLEGYNGIGKSAAIRLLELCTGYSPTRGRTMHGGPSALNSPAHGSW